MVIEILELLTSEDKMVSSVIKSCHWRLCVNRPTTVWQLGRIILVYFGDDGVVRIVTVRTKDGDCYKRPVVHLAFLPINDNSDS